MRRYILLGILSCVVLLAVADTAQAQINLGGMRLGLPRLGNLQLGPGLYVGPRSRYVGPEVMVEPQPGVRQAFYPVLPPENQALIRVSLPAPDARVYFKDTLTQQAGIERLFVSPQLERGKTYTYTINATWMENGREVSKTRDVDVQAGREVLVSFVELPRPTEVRPASQPQ